jgi:hypothetical protein
MQRQGGGRDVLVVLVEVAQRQPVFAQRGEHARPAHEDHRHAGGLQAPAEVAADRACAHHEHRAGFMTVR